VRIGKFKMNILFKSYIKCIYIIINIPATDNDSTDDPLLHRKKSSEKPEPKSGRLRGGTEVR